MSLPFLSSTLLVLRRACGVRRVGLGGLPASTTPSRVRVEGCLKKKVCTPLTRAQPQGQVKSSVTTFPQPAQPGKAEREWDRFWELQWGGVLARLSRSCLAVSARAQASEPRWRRWTTWRQKKFQKIACPDGYLRAVHFIRTWGGDPWEEGLGESGHRSCISGRPSVPETGVCIICWVFLCQLFAWLLQEASPS